MKIDRYAMVVDLQSKVFETNEQLLNRANALGIARHKIKDSNDLRTYELFDQLHNSIDDLLGFMLNNFVPTYDQETQTAIDDVQNHRVTIDTMGIEDLTQHLDAVVVFAVMKRICKTPTIPFYPNKTPSWETFVNQYYFLVGVKCGDQI
jgi:hypothetical protein